MTNLLQAPFPPPPPLPPPNNLLHKSPKIMLPTFDGTCPLDWLFQADQYFTFYNILVDQRVALASFHFQVDDLSWYKYMHNNGLLGLRPDIQQEIAIYHPTTLHQTYGIAKLVEDELAATQSQFTSSTHPPLIAPTTQTTTTQSIANPPAILLKPVKQTTPLPTRCHRCNPPQFLLLRNDEPMPLTIDTKALNNLENHSYDIQPLQFLALSTAVLHGTTCPLAIRIIGHINGHSVTVLVDFGSSHDIIKPCLVSFLNLPSDSQPSFPVMIGDGTFLHCTGQCLNVELCLSETPFSISPYVFSIEGADVVLGMSWLSRLGVVKADFSMPQLTFNHLDKEVTLRGESLPKLGTSTDLEDRVVVQQEGIATNMIEPVKAKACLNQEH
nr:hypothetical protein [Tanacetum cinerariifolium]